MLFRVNLSVMVMATLYLQCLLTLPITHSVEPVVFFLPVLFSLSPKICTPLWSQGHECMSYHGITSFNNSQYFFRCPFLAAASSF